MHQCGPEVVNKSLGAILRKIPVSTRSISLLFALRQENLDEWRHDAGESSYVANDALDEIDEHHNKNGKHHVFKKASY